MILCPSWFMGLNSVTMKILVLNSGSSTQKSALFDLGTSASSAEPVAAICGKANWSGTATKRS